MQDLSEYEAGNVHRLEPETAEESGIEELCNYERYLELQTDIHEESVIQGECAWNDYAHLIDSLLAFVVMACPLQPNCLYLSPSFQCIQRAKYLLKSSKFVS